VKEQSYQKNIKKRTDAVKEIKRALAPGKLNVPGD